MRCGLLRGEGGSAVVEIGLVVALLVPPLLVGSAETATVIYSSIEVSNAAHAGAMYGMVSAANAASTAEIQTAARNEATDFGNALTATPTVYYACSSAENGTQYTTQSAATSACTGSGNHALEFVKVSTSVTMTPPFHFAGIPANYALTGVSVMEVQE